MGSGAVLDKLPLLVDSSMLPSSAQLSSFGVHKKTPVRKPGGSLSNQLPRKVARFVSLIQDNDEVYRFRFTASVSISSEVVITLALD